MSIEISKDFIGGNISVQSIESISDNDVCVHLKNEIRDTVGDWFYWAFKASGANGKTVKFIFDEPNRVGYFGAAVSNDLENWKWVENRDGESFTYTFAEDETEVYFAHHMLYHPNRFEKLADKLGLEIKTLCKSKKGRDIPYVEIGDANKVVFFAARHHACESTGDYILEGVLKELTSNKEFIKHYKIICVPFVDYDGVVDGDQGKARAPHDHNNDYNNKIEPIYESVRKIRELARNCEVHFAFDLHSPWHNTGMNDTAFIVHKTLEEYRVANLRKFGALFEQKVKENPKSFKYYTKDDLAYGVDWNKVRKEGSAYAAFMWGLKNIELTFTLETAYFGTSDGSNKTSDSGLVECGKCFARALLEYIG